VAGVEAGSWFVRKLAEACGLSKSNVVKVEKQLVPRGVLRELEGGFHIRDNAQLQEELLRGYELALCPKLLIGRFRSPVSHVDDMLASVREAFAERFDGPQPVGQPLMLSKSFIWDWNCQSSSTLSPTSSVGSCGSFLTNPGHLSSYARSFGTVPFRRETGPLPVARPLLIYSELMLLF